MKRRASDFIRFTLLDKVWFALSVTTFVLLSFTVAYLVFTTIQDNRRPITFTQDRFATIDSNYEVCQGGIMTYTSTYYVRHPGVIIMTISMWYSLEYNTTVATSRVPEWSYYPTPGLQTKTNAILVPRSLPLGEYEYRVVSQGVGSLATKHFVHVTVISCDPPATSE